MTIVNYALFTKIIFAIVKLTYTIIMLSAFSDFLKLDSFPLENLIYFLVLGILDVI